MSDKRDSERLRIHPSILTSLCWKKAEFRYVYRIRKPSSLAQVVGTATHRTYRSDLAYSAVTRERLPEEFVRDRAADDFERTWNSRDGVELYLPEEKELGLDLARGRAKDQTIDLASVAHNRLAPTVTGVKHVNDLERRIDLRISGAPFDLSGVIDVVESGKRVRDTKTRSQKPTEGDLAASIQLSVYTLALEKQGEPVEEMALDVIHKKSSPECHTLTTAAPTDHSATLERIRVASGIFETGLFYPIDPNSQTGKWACTERFCEYYDECPFGRRRRTSVSIAKL